MQYEDMRTYAEGLFRESEGLKGQTAEALAALGAEKDLKAKL